MTLWSKILGWFAKPAAATLPSGIGGTGTEFSAEVVRITRVLPHPNADRLEIARFEMSGTSETSYEVVVQKNTASPGDLMAYFSVDCLLPTSHPEFAFLKTRLDGEGKEVYRLRAARLRGVFSQGLLTKAPPGAALGQPMAEAFGVTYHRDPEPKQAQSLTGSRPRTKIPFVPVYSVDSLKKAPRLFQPGEPVMVTEKIHGTNFRFGWVRRKLWGIPFGWRFIVGSHNVIKDGKSVGHFYGSDVWNQAADAMRLAEVTKGHKGMVFYGELYGHTYDGKRIQDLTYGRPDTLGPGLAIFDVRDMSNGRWLGGWERLDLCEVLGLPHAPLLYGYIHYFDGLAQLTAGDTKLGVTGANEVLRCTPRSTLDAKTVREGVVVEALSGNRRKAKWVSEAYLTRKDAS